MNRLLGLFLLLSCSMYATAAQRSELVPVELATIKRLDQGEGIDVDRAVVSDGSGGGWIVYEHTDSEFTRGELRAIRFEGCGHLCVRYSTSIKLAVPSPAVYVGSPSLVSLDGRTWLYFVEADGFRSPGVVRRARFESGQLSEFELVNPGGPLSPWSCPRFAVSASGQFGMIQRKRGSAVIAFSADGTTFGTQHVLAEETGSTPALAAFDDGRWVVAFQHGPMAHKQSYFRIAHAAAPGEEPTGWGDRQKVNAALDNVHNTVPVPRRDGRIDLYYITPPEGWRGFALYRRCLEKEGKLGEPEQLVPQEFGNLLEPLAARIAADTLLLTFNEQRTGHRLHAAAISHEAACPSDGA